MDYTENTSTERRALELLKATVRQLEGLMQEAMGAGDYESLVCVAPWAAKLRALLDVDGTASTRRVGGCPSSLLIQREWYRWWPYDERRNPGRRARALAEITRSMGRGAGQRNREGPQQSTRSD